MFISAIGRESEVAQSCPTLCDPVNCSPPGAFVHGILQARILEWVAISFSNGDGGTLQKNITGMCGSAHRVWATLGLPPLTAHVLSRSTLLRLQNALQGNCLKWALGCMLFPGLSCSGSGSWVLHKGTDSVGSVFCAIHRSEQLR